mmetsp:Transcript_25012/g.71447  ORF Transcript_25012/g.71447 Transcript_25012/m.71447 type:complete len:486 (+) Transcript_25012:1655-3112(+)
MRRASSYNAATSAPAAESCCWVCARRRSMASKRTRVESSSDMSKRVAPSRAASEFTDKLPFLAMASPAKVTTLQLKPAARTCPKARRRPSAIVSATTTSPRMNSKARANRSSKDTQFRAKRDARSLFTISPRRGSEAATRRSAKGRKVIGASMRSFKYRTQALAVSEVSTTTASRYRLSATFTATCNRFCTGRQRSMIRPCTPCTAEDKFEQTFDNSFSRAICRSVAAMSCTVSMSCWRSAVSCSFSSPRIKAAALSLANSAERSCAKAAAFFAAAPAVCSASRSSATLASRKPRRAVYSRSSVSTWALSAATARICCSNCRTLPPLAAVMRSVSLRTRANSSRCAGVKRRSRSADNPASSRCSASSLASSWRRSTTCACNFSAFESSLCRFSLSSWIRPWRKEKRLFAETRSGFTRSNLAFVATRAFSARWASKCAWARSRSAASTALWCFFAAAFASSACVERRPRSLEDSSSWRAMPWRRKR